MLTYSTMCVNIHIAMSTGGIKPNMATSTVLKFGEIHTGTNRLKPKNLDK